jgi:predicted nuclease with RNAse H fold
MEETEEKKNNLLALGWDVGGWMGNNHGFSIIHWDYDKKDFKWLGEAVELRIPADSIFSLDYIIEKITKRNDIDLFDFDIVIGVDAPLRFPKEFKEFINGNSQEFKRPEKEIYNPLAYRKTDVHIYETLGKKPLSAVFDRLGTNCTAAMVHIQKWMEEYDLSLQPIIDKENNRDIIEVYPALLKASKYSPADEPFKTLLPDSVSAGTDAYDAALCAIMALAYGAADAFAELPNLVHPKQIDEDIKEEGWIYYFPLD